MCDTEDLEKAISSKKLISFTYENDPKRIAEPHVLGIRNNRTLLHTYQIDGYSKKGNLPGWRFFDIKSIENLEILEETFDGRRYTPSGNHKDWDDIIKIVD